MILDDLVTATKKRMVVEKEIHSLDELKQQSQKAPMKNPHLIVDKLLEPKLTFIAEIKKASPSKGVIVQDFPYLEIAQEYQANKIDMISVLTEPDYFQGNLKYLQQITQEVDLPVLRKDFTIDSYMIYQAKIAQASLILLIVAILSDGQLKDYLKLAKELGLAAIVEVHDETELKRALRAKSEIIGINNRNLKDFSVNFNNSLKLKKLIPADIPVIAESGIKTKADIKLLKKAGINGVLIGETFMKAKNKAEIINDFKSV
ncbi:indole-3-glycerol phosphate synthase TrpC [Companilactobacillus farciminis]|uniref:indole-3-glycerol phosphate synthase TrpC n=1 Tax=Companilactobacillus farciminis TaxID=1612 RepID=UPI00232E5B81|nr:indole-3-glycerol phosphate synthase TrpC [Companilactobacillus farciminis]WCG35130.1 indole-3-glycerol phosphate synthase TrpC [Companilactobacillus farciminis]